MSVRLPSGELIPVLGRALVGRNPQARARESADQLIALGNSDRSVSKTHAVLEASRGGIDVSDRGSTNGTLIVTAAGETLACEPDVPVFAPVGSCIRVGSFELRVERA